MVCEGATCIYKCIQFGDKYFSCRISSDAPRAFLSQRTHHTDTMFLRTIC